MKPTIFALLSFAALTACDNSDSGSSSAQVNEPLDEIILSDNQEGDSLVSGEGDLNEPLGETILCDSKEGDSSISGSVDFYDHVELNSSDLLVVTINNTTPLNANEIEIARACIPISENQQLPIQYNMQYLDSDIIRDYWARQTTKVNIKMNLPAHETTPIVAPGNFDPLDPLTYNHSTSVSIYDSIGDYYILTYFFIKTDNANEWLMFMAIDGIAISAQEPEGIILPVAGDVSGGIYNESNGAGIKGVKITFSNTGDLISQIPMPENGGIVTEALGVDILINGADESQTIATNLNFDPLYTNVNEPTQFASNFLVELLSQDGVRDSSTGYMYSATFSYYSMLEDGSYLLEHQSQDPNYVITNGWSNYLDVILDGVAKEE